MLPDEPRRYTQIVSREASALGPAAFTDSGHSSDALIGAFAFYRLRLVCKSGAVGATRLRSAHWSRRIAGTLSCRISLPVDSRR